MRADASDGDLPPGPRGWALGLPDAEQPPPKDYAYRNGQVFIGGDVVTDCRSFVSEYYLRAATSGERAQAERVLEQCEQAGLAALPGTGGDPVPLLAAGVLLVCAGLGQVAIRPSA